MEHIGWTPQMAVGIASIDVPHQALIEHIATLMEQPDGNFWPGMTALVEHLERDFRAEEELMESIDYPGVAPHREQHARVLASLHGLNPDDLAAARKAVALLPLWFEMHLATMDTVLAVAAQLAAAEAFQDGPTPAPEAPR